MQCSFAFWCVFTVNRMATFPVDEVKKEAVPCKTSKPLEIITNYTRAKPESCFQFPDSLNPVYSGLTRNSFVGTVHLAYSQHYPLVLSPDMLWQCVAQGFAMHVNQNAKKLRHMFVAHAGKKVIAVRKDSFVKGSPDNKWEEAFGQFSEEIRKNVGDEIHGALTPEFTTTGPVERAAAQVVLMDTLKEYFEYVVMTECGIPEITLEGTTEDWIKLREKALSLGRFNLKWWTKPLGEILDEFVSASSGKPNREFWQSIYKVYNESGGTTVSGWIVTLFPYLGSSIKNMHRNGGLTMWRQENFWGIQTSDIPKGFVSTPFKWLYFDEEFEMHFYGGFLGTGQDKESLTLRPVIGWAVVDSEEEEKSKMNQRIRLF